MIHLVSDNTAGNFQKTRLLAERTPSERELCCQNFGVDRPRESYPQARLVHCALENN